MSFTVVLDSDGLIKLAKAGILEVAVNAWNCLVPQAVYAETVEGGLQAAYPDALAIREVLRPTHLPYLVPALALVRLAQHRHLDPGAALEALQRMHAFIRSEVYEAARADIEGLQAQLGSAREGEKP